MNRHEMRKAAFMLTFEKIFINESCDTIIADAIDAELFDITDDCSMLFKMIYAHVDAIDELISQNLKKWTISRISKTALAILRVAICEMQYCENVPVSVAINEAVELAKEFSGEEDASFINGVLGSIDRANKPVDA